MCGIVGFYNPSLNYSDEELKKYLSNMSSTLIHRGPDNHGIWTDCNAGISLGHRRLSILDLSPEGHQPMASASERYIITFNGEIYNFKVIRRELERLGVIFRGHSDTEIMLAAIEEWGLTSAVTRFVGMFAFALWDRKTNLLHLVRDRMGEKPLYYGWSNNTFIFASELKAIKVHPDFKGEIDRDALTLYLRHCYIPSPYSIYKGIYKLPPGSILTVETSNPTAKPKSYWSVLAAAEKGISMPFSGTDTEAIGLLDSLLRDVIKQQMIADVPLGAFLSGGIDSSAIVALMQSISSQPVKTFTIGFNEEGYNEAQHAKKVANHLGTNHTEMYVTAQEAIDVIPKLPTLYDEPFSDSSQIPTYLVSLLAKQHVTVCLSGDGGDELFYGYNRYFIAQRIWNKLSRIPFPIRYPMSALIKAVPISFWNNIFGWMSPLVKKYSRTGNVGDKIHKLADFTGINNFVMLYKMLISHWKDPSELVINSTEPNLIIDQPKGVTCGEHNFMMFLDSTTYLPDDILVKVDRASMGVSLESRIPLLNHGIVEFSWSLPFSMKYRDGQSKWLLRQVLYKYVPKEIIDRPKMGFGLPIDGWLRGPLREWAEELLDEKRLRAEGFFNPEPIRLKWREHLEGSRNWHYYLWDVLMFQAWFEQNHSK